MPSYTTKVVSEVLRNARNSKYFQWIDSKTTADELAAHISAFANADGGNIAMWVSEDTLPPGFTPSPDYEADLRSHFEVFQYCFMLGSSSTYVMDFPDENGQMRNIFLLGIAPCEMLVPRRSDHRFFLRVADTSRELTDREADSLEWEKGSLHFEYDPCGSAKLSDLDGDLLRAYQERLSVMLQMSVEELLSARGLTQRGYRGDDLTNAAVLLFAENPRKFHLNTRIRFLRINGRELQTGAGGNVVTDKSFDGPILRQVGAVKEFLSDQLRDWDAPAGGRTPRAFPEFPWYEGLINAVAHRDYEQSDQDIVIRMYDDRLEIESPGPLPGPVHTRNIRFMRNSRNKTIYWTMMEYGLIQDTSQGVDKIYTDMAQAGLPAPRVTKLPGAVRLTLKNHNARSERRSEAARQ